MVTKSLRAFICCGTLQWVGALFLYMPVARLGGIEKGIKILKPPSNIGVLILLRGRLLLLR